MDTHLRQSLLDRLPPNPHPLAIARIDDIAALSHLIRQLEEALEKTGVFFPDPNGGGKINPLVEAIGKNRERLRRAMNDLEKILRANQPDEPRPTDRDAFKDSMRGWEAVAFGDTGFAQEYDPNAPGAPVNFGVPFPDPPEYKGPIPKEDLIKLRQYRPRYVYGPNRTYTIEYPDPQKDNAKPETPPTPP